MKTSIFIIAALLLNTSLLLAEPLASFVKDINPYLQMGAEALLLLGYFTNKWLKDLNKECVLELGYLNIFVVESK